MLAVATIISLSLTPVPSMGAQRPIMLPRTAVRLEAPNKVEPSKRGSHLVDFNANYKARQQEKASLPLKLEDAQVEKISDAMDAATAKAKEKLAFLQSLQNECNEVGGDKLS